MFFSRFFPGKRRFFLFTKTNSLLIMEKMEKFSKGEYDMLKETFHNPLLPGFYPDPSICRVGDDYYMVTSSFVYYPGLPIFHSKDLVHWEQIGHGIHRPEQLNYKNCETSEGLWAPSIRFHKGTFYIINTFVSEGREAKRDNYIITAKNPAGPWSDPIVVEGADGIDSSLFFDEDGSVWYVGNFISDEKLYEGHHGIYLNELDPETLQFKGPRTIIWDGKKTRSKWIEAPHIYKKDGYYYLLVAEGGTFVTHSVQMARCRTIDGDYEICPRNPIVTHRHMPLLNPISVTGHADIVETQNGEWWMVLLAVRPYEGGHYNLGRETFMVPFVWAEDGWPMIDNETGLVQEEERLPKLPRTVYPLMPECDNFEDEALQMQWNTIHPPVEPFYSLTERPGYLRLMTRPQVMEEICTPSFVGRRQRHKSFLAKTAMEFHPASDCEEAGIALVQDDRFHYLMVMKKKGTTPYLQFYKTENGCRTLVKETELKDSRRLYLSVQGNTTDYDFYYGYSESEMIPFLSGVDASLLSPVVNNGFTGVYLGMYTSSAHEPSTSYVDFDWFQYQGE